MGSFSKYPNTATREVRLFSTSVTKYQTAAQPLKILITRTKDVRLRFKFHYRAPLPLLEIDQPLCIKSNSIYIHLQVQNVYRQSHTTTSRTVMDKAQTTVWVKGSQIVLEVKTLHGNKNGSLLPATSPGAKLQLNQICWHASAMSAQMWSLHQQYHWKQGTVLVLH